MHRAFLTLEQLTLEQITPISRAFIIIYSMLGHMTYGKCGISREKLFQCLLNGKKAIHHNSASIYPDVEAILYMRGFKRFTWNSVETSL